MMWISVKDELPEKNKWVLAFTPKEYLTIDVLSYFEIAGDHMWSNRNHRVRTPTHWMPLPEPPAPENTTI